MRFRRFSPIDREYPVFELVDGEDILLDISKNDLGTVEVAFHAALSGRVMEWSTIERALIEGRGLADSE